MHCRLTQHISFFLLLLMPLMAFAAPVQVTGMSLSPAKDKTTIFINVSAKTPGTVTFKPDKKLLTVKFNNASLRFAVQQAKLRNSNIERFSARQEKNNVVLFNFTTTNDVKWKTSFATSKHTKRLQFKLEVISVKEKPVAKPVDKVTSSSKKRMQILQTKRQQAISRAQRQRNQVKVRQTVSQVRPVLKKFTIVIDPGHGGKDSGAIGRAGTKEKDVVLSIAKRLRKKLQSIPCVRVVLTRTKDVYVSLRGRLNTARKYDADLFVSVHADGFYNRKIRGASVYALSPRGATSEAARWLAQQENHSELSGISFSELSDNSKMLRSVLIDMAQTATIRDSLKLGNKMLNSLDAISKLHIKNVGQARFVVLKSPDIPSVLVETGFITNPYEERKLKSAQYQEKLATAMYKSVKWYVGKYGK